MHRCATGYFQMLIYVSCTRAWDVAKMKKTARTVPGCLMSEKEHYLNAQFYLIIGRAHDGSQKK